MKTYFSLFTAIFVFLITPCAYSAWSGQCLDDCFSSRHDCDYCEWFCRTDYSRPLRTAPNDYKECPFINSDGELVY